MESDYTFISFSISIIHPYFDFLVIASTDEHSIVVYVFELELILTSNLLINADYAGD